MNTSVINRIYSDMNCINNDHIINNKNNFYVWLKYNNRLKESTIKKYIYNISAFGKIMNDENYVYYTEDIKSIDNILDLFETNENLKNKNSKHHNEYSCAIKIYREYIQEKSVIDSKDIINEEVIDNIPIKKGENRIYYGAPGTGKSYRVNEIAETEFQAVHRTTFYAEYTHEDFVGSFMPVMNYEIEDSGKKYVYGDGTCSNIKGRPVPFYKFIPGPFAKALVDAMNNPEKNVLLIVEELNRANAAAVFGEVFQLLDRKYNGNADDGESQYGVNISNEFSEFIAENVSDYKLGDKIGIPSNMSIYATMNSADQGVNPIDSAFKRRWNFIYIPIDFENADHKNVEIHYAGRKVTWQNFGYAVNKKLVELGINEDKLLGEYFVNKEEVTDQDKFETKIISYLFEDIFKFNRRGFFKPEYKTFSQLKNDFADKEIFEVQFDYKAEENRLPVTDESEEIPVQNINSNQIETENLDIRE
ncbi:hypothetical protein AWN73_07040 [Clostridium butyricum]|uniref:ATPase dynein-related AAA domain-containing protein n=1 Tax=Clostridium butyricum TaxID=1492 RepID=A0A2S7FF43_CLOBU|nr:AAA family ATPase [Clostridium butyricum]PPV17752.1 hypothetical protein AWN73_07040 [Clostridium butyricum]